MKAIKSLFVPSTCLQGSKLPVHIIWPKERKISVSIKYPDSFDNFEIFNGLCINSDKNIIFCDKYEENGYLGLVFKTKQNSNPKLNLEIEFTFEEAGKETEKIKKNVHFFRPDIKVTRIPSIIKAEKNGKEKFSVSEKIQVINCGEGTAILSLIENDDTELKIHEPNGIGEFVINFWSDFTTSLSRLKEKYTEYSELIDKIIKLKETLSKGIGESEVKNLKDMVNELEKILISDTTFSEDYESIIQTAYFKNLKFITELESFLIYLKSTDSERILLKNPIHVLKIQPEKKKFKGHINIIDLNYNSYPKIPIEFEISATEECELPLHKLLDLQSDKVTE